ncbi:hypothetical protein FoTM2_013882 [Fusarium oxysporum f. sp. vasinfectum]|nr:hypothetical protein FoTM2_013882 [Fusarium oxysporum f. sp. vasinfectum]
MLTKGNPRRLGVHALAIASQAESSTFKTTTSSSAYIFLWASQTVSFLTILTDHINKPTRTNQQDVRPHTAPFQRGDQPFTRPTLHRRQPPLDFKPKIDFQVPGHWMFAALNPITTTWLTAQGRQNEARYGLVNIPISELGDVEARVRSVLPEENPQGEAAFNRQYVRDILKNLVDGGILGEDRARDALLAVETFAKLS